jgi:YidC/Oxa1 family membrane protein insertase
MGFIDTILGPLIYATSWIIVQFHVVFGAIFGKNSIWAWGLSIVLLTVILRAAMIPLFVKQIKSMRNMQALQPKIKAIQQKYKLDKQRQQQEMMKLYRETGTNPLASCLPILIQAPFWSALYRMLDNVAGGHPVGAMTHSLVESARHAKIFGAPIALKFLASHGQLHAFNVTKLNVMLVTGFMILIMVATQFITQRQLILKNTSTTQPNPMVQQQKIMMYGFPIFMLVLGINFPAGLLIYMLTTNVWTMGQQFYVIRNNPMPGSRAAEELAARNAAKQKKRDEAAIARGEVPESAVAVAESAGAAAGGKKGGAAGRAGAAGGVKTNANGVATARPAAPGQRVQPSRKSRSKRKR